MSLINDALKRAKQAQQQYSPDAPQMRVQFRPVEPGQQVKKSNTGIWIAVVIIAGLIIGFVIRQLTRENSPAPKEAKAREIVPAKPIAQETKPSAPTPAAVTPSPTPKPAAQEPAVKEAVAAAPADRQEEPARPAPRLQAVVFDPKRPSAIISGKSVFRGDRVGDFRVVAITRESVTLVGNGQTNVLVLGE
jgi:outer membrane biosynthesis protein TonB